MDAQATVQHVMKHSGSPDDRRSITAAEYASPVLGGTPIVRHPARCRSVLMVGTHPTTMGGISTVVRGYMAGGLFDRFDCLYVATHRDGDRWTKAGAALRGAMRVLVELRRMDEPLVHIHLSSRASTWRKSIVCLLAALNGRPYVLHVHGSEFMQFYYEECAPFAQRLIARMFRHAALVLALSEQWRANLLRICPEARIDVLANAVALPPREALHRRTGEPPTILFMGRLGRRKGTFELLEAFARIAPRHADVRLVCAGDGEIDEVRGRARRLGIADRVDCPGWLDAEASREALAAATVFVLPSHAEGLPMAVLEAMAWALPVIATPVGGIPQLLQDGENGRLVAPGDIDALADALEWMLTHPGERARLGAAARATIEKRYSLEAAVESLSRIYQRFGIPMRTQIR